MKKNSLPIRSLTAALSVKRSLPAILAAGLLMVSSDCAGVACACARCAKDPLSVKRSLPAILAAGLLMGMFS